MTRAILSTAFAIALASLGLSGPSHAAACDPGKDGAELTFEEAQTVYDCIADDLHSGYMKGKKFWIPEEYVSDYRDWTIANTMPANPGFHGGRFLLTWVNETGAGEYLKYKDEDVNIPAGTVIAKESFSVTASGKVRKGPLFIMEKAAAGASPKSDDWFYMMVAPNGRPQAVDVYKACVECHQVNFGHQGGLGYPAHDVRIAQ